MKKIYLLSFFIVFLTTCKKDTPNFTDVLSSEITRYTITLSGNKIDHYSKYINDVLQTTVYFIDHDTIIEKLTKNIENNITDRTLYFIGDIGYATSCIDSGFSDTGLSYITHYDYEYNNGFMTKATVKFKSYSISCDSSLVYYSNYISNDNITSSNVSFQDYTSGCTNYYDYDNNNNIIDVRGFSNGITGKASKNLISHASWNNGCPAGPSMTIASSDYEYEFNSSNYISVIREYYTPCYHMGDAEEVSREIRITIYEYN